MKKVSASENEFSQFVVNMVGCVTVREPFLLVLEYVKHGDLLKYLRAMKNKVRDSKLQDAQFRFNFLFFVLFFS